MACIHRWFDPLEHPHQPKPAIPGPLSLHLGPQIQRIGARL